PSTLSISRPAGENRFRSRMPHSSAVCSRTVRSRHCEVSFRPSKAPMVMLLLPASSASSTYASCKDQSFGSIVLADFEEAGIIETGGNAVNIAAGLMDDDAAARRIAGCVSEEAEDVV